MVLSHASSSRDDDAVASTFASRYVRTALPRYILLLIGAPAA